MTAALLERPVEAYPDLEERAPCLPDKRHTFGPDEPVCLCGALRRGITTADPFVCLFTPNPEWVAWVAAEGQR